MSAGLFPFISFKSLLYGDTPAQQPNSLAQISQEIDSEEQLEMEGIDVDQSETLEMIEQEDMMNNWSKERVSNVVLKNGYWFILCASIESAW